MANYKIVNAEQLDADLSQIGNAIRAKTGSPESLSFPAGMVSEMDAVFEAGRKAEYDAFWDVFQDNGNRTNYLNAFNGKGFTPQNFYPKYDITPIEAREMFVNWNEDYHIMNLKERMEAGGIKFDFSKTTNFDRAFYFNNQFTEFPQMDMTMAKLLDRVFAYNYKMTSIEKLIVGEETVFQNVFLESRVLENLIIGGTIGQNGFDVSQQVRLSHDSLLSIFNALADYSEDTSGKAWTVTIGGTNMAKLTEEELAIAENKGWVVA